MADIKVCVGCNRELPATTEWYHVNQRCLYGVNTKCKACVREYQNKYRANHKEEIAEYQQGYYTQHKKSIAERKKQHRIKTKGAQSAP